jgi:molecular chaperone GrpE
MSRKNGKADVESAMLDAEHELPPSDEREQSGSDGNESASSSAANSSQLELVKAERDSLIDRLARLQAEFENARRRMAQDQQSFREYASADTIKTLLPVLDSFERALKSSQEKSEFRNGVELIFKQLQDTLTKLGLQPIPTEGKQFDPHVHEAIEMVDTEDVPDHEVLEELQRGYKLRDRLLRPAMVKVARNS